MGRRGVSRCPRTLAACERRKGAVQVELDDDGVRQHLTVGEADVGVCRQFGTGVDEHGGEVLGANVGHQHYPSLERGAYEDEVARLDCSHTYFKGA
jgi:hypothetical protein